MAIAILAQSPSGLGYPSEMAQSSYYPGKNAMSSQEIAAVTKVMDDIGLHPENTRIRKVEHGSNISYDVLQASIEVSEKPRELGTSTYGKVRLLQGDHNTELQHVCDCMKTAQKHASNLVQSNYISKYLHSFVSGDIESFKDSQKTWVNDFQPPVEVIFGFQEPYRDPFGVRAGFEGLVAVVNKDETRLLTKLVEESTKYIRRLPWTEGMTSNDGKGPFEKELFSNVDFTSLHSKSNRDDYLSY